MSLRFANVAICIQLTKQYKHCFFVCEMLVLFVHLCLFYFYLAHLSLWHLYFVILFDTIVREIVCFCICFVTCRCVRSVFGILKRYDCLRNALILPVKRMYFPGNTTNLLLFDSISGAMQAFSDSEYSIAPEIQSS